LTLFSRVRKRTLLVLPLSMLLSCSDEFTGIDDAAGGRSSVGASDAGSGNADAGRGGKPAVSGGDAGSAGKVIEPADGGSNAAAGAESGGAGGTEAVEPLAIPQDGLELWLRADHGVLEEAGVIATWKDSSTKQRDASQTAVNYRPKLMKDAMGSLAAVTLDGVDDYLKLPAIDVDFSGGVSIFAVARQDVAGECEGLFEAANGSEIDDLHLGTWKGAAIYEVGAPYIHAAQNPTILGGAELLAAVHQVSGAAQLRRNSNGLGEGTLELPSVVTRAEAFIGHTLYAGCSPWKGAIAELLVYSRAVSDAELVEIETYLQDKWSCCRE
jgi:hypothetical protein